MNARQLDALDFVRERIAEIGASPTIGEVAQHLDTSPSSARRTVDGLVGAGWMRRQPRAARGLDVPCEVDLRTTPTAALHAELARRGVTLSALDAPMPEPRTHHASCAADSCFSPVRRGHAFCRPHWFAIPNDLRDDLLVVHAQARRRVAGALDRYQELLTRARDIADGCGGAF